MQRPNNVLNLLMQLSFRYLHVVHNDQRPCIILSACVGSQWLEVVLVSVFLSFAIKNRNHICSYKGMMAEDEFS